METYKMNEEVIVLLCRTIGSLSEIPRREKRTPSIPLHQLILPQSKNGIPTIISIFVLFSVSNMNILHGTNVLHGHSWVKTIVSMTDNPDLLRCKRFTHAYRVMLKYMLCVLK